MQPLKITWRFSSPVVAGDFPIHLDALLAFVQVDRALQDGAEQQEAYARQDELPLAQQGGVWKASQVVFKPITAPMTFPMIRRLDLNGIALDHQAGFWAGGKNKFSMGTGKYKAFDFRAQCQWMDRAVAWCVGDKELIENLLGELTHLGKLVRNGFGKILEMTIEEAPQDEANFWKLRVLPEKSGFELPGFLYAPSFQNIRPPYWSKLTKQTAMVPLDADRALRS